MFAALTVATTPAATTPLPFVVILGTAVIALVCIGVAVRRLRARGTLTFANASTSAAAAAFVLAAALLASVSVGVPTPAVAAPYVPSAATSTGDGYQPIPIEGLEGYQLPTK
ncbi:MAG: hypothetical protein ABI238_01010 [Terrimesophilobacter sp.]